MKRQLLVTFQLTVLLIGFHPSTANSTCQTVTLNGTQYYLIQNKVTIDNSFCSNGVLMETNSGAYYEFTGLGPTSDSIWVKIYFDNHSTQDWYQVYNWNTQKYDKVKPIPNVMNRFRDSIKVSPINYLSGGKLRVYVDVGIDGYLKLCSVTVVCITSRTGPTNLAPINNAEDVALSPIFTWSPDCAIDSQRIQLSTSTNFANPIWDKWQNALASSKPYDGQTALTYGTSYWWRVINYYGTISVTQSGSPYKFTTTIPNELSLVTYGPSSLSNDCKEAPPLKLYGTLRFSSSANRYLQVFALDAQNNIHACNTYSVGRGAGQQLNVETLTWLGPAQSNTFRLRVWLTDYRCSDITYTKEKEVTSGDIQYSYSKDQTPPNSAIEPLAETTYGLFFDVRWSGSDVGSCVSGLSNYQIQYKDQVSGTWTDWYPGTSQTSATFGPLSPVTVIDGHTYYFRSRARDVAGNIEDWPASPDGDTHTKVASSQGQLTLTQPNGGEVLRGGSIYKIKWQPAGFWFVALSYSVDNGANWNPIDTRQNVSEYDWKVPQEASTQCLVRICDIDGNPCDASDHPFEILSTRPFVKVIGLMQKANNRESHPLGLEWDVQTKDEDGPVELTFFMNNIDDYWDGYREVKRQPYYVSGDSAYFWNELISEQPLAVINDGDRIKWRLEAVDIYGAKTYFPGPTSSETEKTVVLSYGSIHSSLNIVKPGVQPWLRPAVQGTIRKDAGGNVINDLAITLYNNRCVNFAINADFIPTNLTKSSSIKYSSGSILDVQELLHVLPKKSFPFDFANAPSIELSNLQFTNPADVLRVEVDPSSLKAIGVLIVDLVFQAVGADLVKLDKVNPQIIPEIVDALSEAMDAATFANGLSSMTWDVASIGDNLFNLSTMFYNALQNPSVKAKVVAIFSHYGAPGLVNTFLSGFQALAGKVLFAANLGFVLFDYMKIAADLTRPVKDEFLFANRNAVKVAVQPISVPGHGGSPVVVGSNPPIAFLITNTSQQKLYNVWFGLDIYDPDGSKVENTWSPIEDPVEHGGTGHQGLIEFANQGSDLDIGQTVALTAQGYVFGKSVTGFDYSASAAPYSYRFRAWTNGYPGQVAPLTAISLSDSSLPFYLSDNIPPKAPTLNLPTYDDQFPNSMVLNWSTDPADIDVRFFTVYFYYEPIPGFVPIPTEFDYVPNVDGAPRVQAIVPIVNRTSYYQVSATDIGGHEGPLSAPVKVSPWMVDAKITGFPALRRVGGSQEINWTSGPSVGSGVSIDCWNGSGWKQITSPFANHAGSNGYSWTIPSDEPSVSLNWPGVDRKIRVYPTQLPDKFVESQQFDIDGFVLSSPNGGETYQTTSTQNIQWSTFGTLAKVRLEISLDDGINWHEITPSEGWPANTPFPWTIPPDAQVSNTCRIRISDFGDASNADMSDETFAIATSEPALNAISIAPASPELGATTEIYWHSQASVGNSVKIQLFGDGVWKDIGVFPNIPGQNSRSWQVWNGDANRNANVAGNHRRIRLISVENNQSQNTGDEFSITGPLVDQSLVGRTFVMGNPLPIRWTQFGPTTTTSIDLSVDGGLTWMAITPPGGITSNGSWDWQIPVDFKESSTCLVRVRNEGNNLVNDVSDGMFKISNPSKPNIPSDVALTIGVDSLVISWSAVFAANSYNVYRDGDLMVPATSDRFAIDNNPGTEAHCYQVTAIGEFGPSDRSEAVCGQTRVLGLKHVTQDGVDAMATGSLQHPFRTIAKAVASAKQGDSILVMDGIYLEHIVLDKAITLTGVGEDRVFLDGDFDNQSGDSANSCLTINNAAGVRLQHLTIEGGRGSRLSPNRGAGGGILCKSSEVHLENVVIKSCGIVPGDSSVGSGLCLINSKSRLDWCKFTSNQDTRFELTSRGGGIFADSLSTLHVMNSTFSNNVAGAGGAIYSQARGFICDRNSFAGNTVGGSIWNFGGAIAILGPQSIVVNSEFYHNQGGAFLPVPSRPNGGAISIQSDSCTIRKCTFEGNSVSGDITVLSPIGGGAITVQGNCCIIDSSNFKGNTCTDMGYGRATGGAVAIQGDQCSFAWNVVDSSYLSTQSGHYWGSTSFGQGGGLSWSGLGGTIANNTFARNRVYAEGWGYQGPGVSFAEGGGVYIAAGTEFSRNIIVACDASSTASPDPLNAHSTGGGIFSPSENTACNDVWSNTPTNWNDSITVPLKNFSTDPQFCSIANGDYHLLSSSPCGPFIGYCSGLVGAKNVDANCGGSCCSEFTGNLDCDPDGAVDISDLTRLIDYLFISLSPLCCDASADLDGQDGIDIVDLTVLIDHLYIELRALPKCGWYVKKQ